MENVYEQFIDAAGSIFEHLCALICPKLAEANVSEKPEQDGIEAIFKNLFLAVLLLTHQERE